MQLDGVLFFPVTPFTVTGEVSEGVLAEHVKHGVDAGPGGVFVACGTGEFHAMEPEEYERVVRVAVEATAGKVPVFAGAGGPLPLVPYLVGSPAEGLGDYVEQVASASDLPLIVYQRNNAVFTPASAVRVANLPTVIGFKDGLGDLDQMQRIVLAVREAVHKSFRFFNGLPTAEMTVPAYRSIGVELYSSAVFCFAPEISLAFYEAVTGGDSARVNTFLGDFFRPLVELRDLVPGYAVSLVKAGVRLRGLDVGSVRAPLIDPTPEHVRELERIINTGLELV